jgi:ABC-type ATPase involved in cell division
VQWLAQRLQAERARGLAILMASHEPSLVKAVATREVRLAGAALATAAADSADEAE